MSVCFPNPQLILPESVKPRHNYSITATSLGPGLTEVLVFGGRLKWKDNPIAETCILRFGEEILLVTKIDQLLLNMHLPAIKRHAHATLYK